MEIWAKFAILVTAIPIITGLYFVLRSKNGGGVENVKTFIAAVYEHEPFDPLEECTKNGKLIFYLYIFIKVFFKFVKKRKLLKQSN